MSYEYDRYLEQRENFPDLTYFDNVEHQVCFGHDVSKSDPEEYRAYDAYFYGGNRSYRVVSIRLHTKQSQISTMNKSDLSSLFGQSFIFETWLVLRFKERSF